MVEVLSHFYIIKTRRYLTIPEDLLNEDEGTVPPTLAILLHWPLFEIGAPFELNQGVSRLKKGPIKSGLQFDGNP